MDFYVQTRKRSGRSIEFIETRVSAETKEEAISKRRKRAPAQRVIGVRWKENGEWVKSN